MRRSKRILRQRFDIVALLEDGFKAYADRYRSAGNEHAAAIADRLAATSDDVPAEIVQQVFDLWSADFDTAEALAGGTR